MKNRVKTTRLSMAPAVLALSALLAVPAFAQDANPDGGPRVEVNISDDHKVAVHLNLPGHRGSPAYFSDALDAR